MKTIDWNNEYKVKYNVESYLFRYNNYIKGQTNKFIMYSTFGKKSNRDIIKDIDNWYQRCVGAYNVIKQN